MDFTQIKIILTLGLYIAQTNYLYAVDNTTGIFAFA